MTSAVQGSGSCLGQCLVFQQPGLGEGVRHLPFHCGQQREHVLGKHFSKDKLSRFLISGEPPRERWLLAVPGAGPPPEVLCLKVTVPGLGAYGGQKQEPVRMWLCLPPKCHLADPVIN